tara:strand:+ start:614 stop:1363 length:750 start_codon:yes stop_codon:yes gene_type:complete
MSEEMIKRINEVVAKYFEANEEKEWIPIKDIMKDLVEAEVFTKDVKKGMPLRKVLRSLDKAKELDKIPSVHAERKELAIYWYLVREGKIFVEKPTTNMVSQNPEGKTKTINDEAYIMNLCDELLSQTSVRQFTFDGLLGDYHKDGESRTTLPLDAYYEEIKLVIELVNKRSPAPKKGMDKGKRRTISGVTRQEQRLKYQGRKQEFLKKEEINLVEFDYDASFEVDEDLQLIREEEKVKTVLQKLLKAFL